jgi:hypothetical protein
MIAMARVFVMPSVVMRYTRVVIMFTVCMIVAAMIVIRMVVIIRAGFRMDLLVVVSFVACFCVVFKPWHGGSQSNG